MTREYKLNKTELTKLKTQEKLYLQYLPVLKLKQEQIQLELNRIKKALELAREQDAKNYVKLKPYIKLLSDSSGLDIRDLININKTQIPTFQTAPWLLSVMPILKTYLHTQAQIFLLNQEYKIARNNLSKATKKVNLFDIILIPKTKNNIKHIKIFLQDEQIASISRGKLAKLKMEQL